VEAPLVVRIAAPVGVRLLDEELSLVQEPLQDQVDVELSVVGVTDADGDVLEVDEEGEALFVLGVCRQRYLLGGRTKFRIAPSPEASKGTSIPSGTYRSGMASPELRSPDRILNKAMDLFSSKGYGATSVREICEAAAVTKPTLYHFYGSKEGVYRALVDGTLEDFSSDLKARLEASGTAEERLKRVARGYFENAGRHRELMKFIFALIHNPPASAPKTDFTRFYEGVVAEIARRVDEGVARGELCPGPTETRMLVFMGALGESLCSYLIVGRPELTPALADSLVDTIVAGWRP
jgi:AcrR family transcriptional regulator